MTKESKINGLEIYNKVMDTALKIPGARINRSEFLTKELAPFVSEQVILKAVETSTSNANIDPDILDKIAYNVLKYHITFASGIAFLAGLPGGWWLFATIPTDVAQFYYNAMQLAQKLAYIYGWPDLSADVTNDDLKMEIALFIAVMMGNSAAVGAINKLAEELAKGVAQRLPKVALTKYALYNTIRLIARWIGISITKDSFAKGIAKIIPVLGGVFSGGLTLVLMTQMGNRLIKHLKENPFKYDVSI